MALSTDKELSESNGENYYLGEISFFLSIKKYTSVIASSSGCDIALSVTFNNCGGFLRDGT